MSDAGEDTSPEHPRDRLQRLQRELSLEIAIEELRSAGAKTETERCGHTYTIYVTFDPNAQPRYRRSP